MRRVFVARYLGSMYGREGGDLCDGVLTLRMRSSSGAFFRMAAFGGIDLSFMRDESGGLDSELDWCGLD